jgi:hypothetical protein
MTHDSSLKMFKYLYAVAVWWRIGGNKFAKFAREYRVLPVVASVLKARQMSGQPGRHVVLLMVLHVMTSQATGADFAKNVRVDMDGETFSLRVAIKQASNDKRLAMYRRMRAELGATAAGQIELGRWCRKQKLGEEERLHWQIVLMMEPEQPEAAKALGLRPYEGKLLTRDQIEKARQEKKAIKLAERKWGPRLKQIKLALTEGDEAAREAALSELASIHGPHVMALAERLFSVANTDAGLLVVEMYAREARQESTDALVRLAIHAKEAAVRVKAASELRYRPMESYMPSLIGALAARIEFSLRADVEPGGPTLERYEGYAYTGRIVPSLYGVVHLCGNYTNRDVLIWGLETKPFSGLVVSGYRPDRHQVEYVLTRDSPDPDAPYEFRGGFEVLGSGGPNGREPESIRRSVAALEKRIEEVNAAAAELNLRIDAAIREATEANAADGQPPKVEDAADVRPRLWWDWWQKQLRLNNYVGRGTTVWTQLGPVPIEDVLVGDRVLTRNLQTGELKFNLVLGMDVRADVAVTTIEVGGRTIVATPDQPFFVPDEGWRDAHDLKPGMELDSLGGPKRIETIRTGSAHATYSLLISGRPNYFVDSQGFMVHDATRE